MTSDPTVTLHVNAIRVCPGEVLTVWLVTVAGKAGGIQVELRVDHDGKPEMFLDGLAVRPFDEWTQIPPKRAVTSLTDQPPKEQP